jgi:hypothetical protein
MLSSGSIIAGLAPRFAASAFHYLAAVCAWFGKTIALSTKTMCLHLSRLMLPRESDDGFFPF